MFIHRYRLPMVLRSVEHKYINLRIEGGLSLNPSLPVPDVRTLEDHAADSIAGR